jgi:hypothetical protein
MFDGDFSDVGPCSGNYCPASPEQLQRLFGQDDELQPSDEDCLSVANAIATAEYEVLRSQPVPHANTLINSRCENTHPTNAQTIPLCIALGANLTDPAEKACAEGVAGYLSSECDRVVGVAELEGLMLFLWSEHDIEGIPVSDYLSESRPLHGLVVHPRDSLSQVGADLRGMLGRSFEIVAV